MKKLPDMNVRNSQSKLKTRKHGTPCRLKGDEAKYNVGKSEVNTASIQLYYSAWSRSKRELFPASIDSNWPSRFLILAACKVKARILMWGTAAAAKFSVLPFYFQVQKQHSPKLNNCIREAVRIRVIIIFHLRKHIERQVLNTVWLNIGSTRVKLKELWTE